MEAAHHNRRMHIVTTKRMNHQAEVKALARQWGVEIEKTLTDDGWQIDVVAPDGKCWDEGLTVIIGHFGGTWGKASEAWEDIHTRMMEGLKDEEDEA